MARTAGTSGLSAGWRRTVSADSPPEITASTTRAAAASAAAPGAQGPLAKLPPRERQAVGEVAHADRPTPRTLDLRDRKTPVAALNEHRSVVNSDDHAGIYPVCDLFPG